MKKNRSFKKNQLKIKMVPPNKKTIKGQKEFDQKTLNYK